MKKLLSFVLILVLVLSFAGCKEEPEAPQETEHIHIWKPATCEAPKTCVSCRLTEGEALSHLLDVGTCTQCNTIQNEELLVKLYKNLSTLRNMVVAQNDDYLQNAYASTKDPAKLSQAINIAQPHFDKLAPTLDSSIALCGDYDELAAIKALLETARTHYPKKPAELTDENLKTYFADANTCSKNISDALLLVQKIK